MRKWAAFLLILLPMAFPPNSTSALADGPSLKLRAPRMTFMRPRMPNDRIRPTVTVRVTAQMEDLDQIEDAEEYYCLEEIWDWDDDTESEYEPDCEPYQEGADLKTQFSATHQYRYPGTYNVYLRLERNGKTILAGNTRIEIRS